MSCSIYVLSLENGKYYVGRTEKPNERINQHFTGEGSEWTKKYKPKEIQIVYNGCSRSDEEKYTLEMMVKYGIDNVRGASHCQVVLTESEIEFLTREIWNIKGLCFRCGGKHFIKDCTMNETKKTCIDNILGWFSKLNCCCYRRTSPLSRRIYLSVPYSRKDESKKLGAKWDSDKKKWFAPDDSFKELIETFKFQQ
jgi:predicted GIY-YIG superfamily endonuclease